MTEGNTFAFETLQQNTTEGSTRRQWKYWETANVQQVVFQPLELRLKMAPEKLMRRKSSGLTQRYVGRLYTWTSFISKPMSHMPDTVKSSPLTQHQSRFSGMSQSNADSKTSSYNTIVLQHLYSVVGIGCWLSIYVLLILSFS